MRDELLRLEVVCSGDLEMSKLESSSHYDTGQRKLMTVLRPTFSGDRPPSKAFLVSSARDMGKRCIHDVSNNVYLLQLISKREKLDKVSNRLAGGGEVVHTRCSSSRVRSLNLRVLCSMWT